MYVKGINTLRSFLDALQDLVDVVLVLLAESEVLLVIHIAELEKLEHALPLVLVLEFLSLLRVFHLGLVLDQRFACLEWRLLNRLLDRLWSHVVWPVLGVGLSILSLLLVRKVRILLLGLELLVLVVSGHDLRGWYSRLLRKLHLFWWLLRRLSLSGRHIVLCINFSKHID